MKELPINTDIVNNKSRHTNNHHVDYYFYTDKSDRIALPEKDCGEHIKGICFADFKYHFLKLGKKPNRVLYVMGEDLKSKQLSLSEKQEWIRMARKHKLLPRYVVLRSAETNKMALDITSIPPSLLYCYLSTFRYIREDPQFIRAMIYLVNERKINFYAAFVLASRICLPQSGHSIIDHTRIYMSESNPNKELVPVGRMRALYKFVRNPFLYDSRNMRCIEEGTFSSSIFFNCQGTINKACYKNTKIAPDKIFDPRIKEAIETQDDKRAEEIVKDITMK